MIRPRKGFSLIELLVVIAIIAILAAILFPVFARAKANAKLQNCMSNLRQLGSAMNMYLDSYGDRFPWAGATDYRAHDNRVAPLGIGGSKMCFDALKPFVKNNEIRWCPETARKNRNATGWSYWYYCPHWNTDPVGNEWVARINGGKAALCGHSLSEIRYTTKKPIICEVSSQHERYDGTRHYLYPILYADGHTRAVVIASDTDPKLSEYLYVGIDNTFNGVPSKL